MITQLAARHVLLLSMSAALVHSGVGLARTRNAVDSPRPPAAERTRQANDSTLRTSAHAKLVCVACHTSLDPKNLRAGTAIAPVNCLRCHADAQFKHDFHPELARAIRANRPPRVTCKECHGTHDITSPADPESKFSQAHIVQSCGQCHEKPAESFPGSVHGMALAAGAKGAPTCLTCHRATITAVSGTMDSLSLKSAQSRACLSCHLDTPDNRARMSLDARVIAPWDGSKHGSALSHGKSGAANCVSCHGSHEIRKVTDTASLVSRKNVANTCASCHAKERLEFTASVHGLAKGHGQTDSLGCSTCHTEHADPFAAGSTRAGVTDSVPAQVCQRCHQPVVLSGTYGLASDRFQSFSDSYHGLTIRGDVFQAANCASCHGMHDVKPVKDPASRVNKANRTVNCGRCHQRAVERFAIGPVHGPVLRAAPQRFDWRVPAAVLLGAFAVVVLLALWMVRRRLPENRRLT